MIIRHYFWAGYYAFPHKIQKGISHFFQDYLASKGERPEYSHKLLKHYVLHDPQAQNWPWVVISLPPLPYLYSFTLRLSEANVFLKQKAVPTQVENEGTVVVVVVFQNRESITGPQ